MVTCARIPIALTDPFSVDDTLQELFSASLLVRHPEVVQMVFEPGNGPYRQYLLVHFNERKTKFAASCITDDVVSRIMRRTSGGADVLRHAFQ